MKKFLLFFIICFSGLNGYSQMTDNTAGLVINPQVLVSREQRENLSRFIRKIEKLNITIETAKGTKVVRKARAEAIKLMTQTRIIASSELLAATQEVYILADNKYNEFLLGDNRAKAIAKNK